ncbi:hypothetical protein D4M08_07885, partial [Campylobacter coli]
MNAKCQKLPPLIAILKNNLHKYFLICNLFFWRPYFRALAIKLCKCSTFAYPVLLLQAIITKYKLFLQTFQS